MLVVIRTEKVHEGVKPLARLYWLGFALHIQEFINNINVLKRGAS